jgi:hypothetical protein
MRHFSVYSVLSWRNDAKNDSGCIISELHKTDKMSCHNNKGNIFKKKNPSELFYYLLLFAPFRSCLHLVFISQTSLLFPHFALFTDDLY